MSLKSKPAIITQPYYSMKKDYILLIQIIFLHQTLK